MLNLTNRHAVEQVASVLFRYSDTDLFWQTKLFGNLTVSLLL
jgi:hypothetical protein